MGKFSVRIAFQTFFWILPPGILALAGFWFFQPLGDLRGIFFLLGALSAWILTGRSSARPEGRVLSSWEAPALAEILRTLAGRARLSRVPRLVLVPGSLINAAASLESGGTVYVTEGLLRHLDLREVEAVLAHEVSHLRHGDLWVSRFWESVLLGVQSSALGAFWLLPLTPAGQLTLTVLLFFLPTVFRLLHSSFLRSREFAADQGAALLTGDPHALAQALARIEYRQGRPWWWPLPEVRLDRTHPDSSLRIRRLLDLKNSIPVWRRGWAA